MEFRTPCPKFRLGLTNNTCKIGLTSPLCNAIIAILGLTYFLAIVSSYCVSCSTTVTSCHNTSKDAHMYLGTKTPYRFIANKDDSPFQFQGCKASRIWMIIRHGTRNPGHKMIRKMREELPKLKEDILQAHREGKGHLCSESILHLEGWQPHVEEVDEKMLTHEGEDEMVELAERFQNKFPELFPEIYTNSSYKFRYTATQRTLQSARYFTIGLFGRRVSRHVWFPEALYHDPILRFYKLCNRWKKEVDKNPDSLLERNKFTESELAKESFLHISQRLGFEEPISADAAHLMYMTCAFETAWEKRRPSPWCAAFSDADLQVMEYVQDLEYYWVDGYGFPVTYRQACPAVQDAMRHLTSTGPSPSAVAYFTHSGTVLKVLAHLGLYRDPQPLRHDRHRPARLWRVGRIDAFASNIAFVLYRCGEGGEPKVLTLHQERAVTLPGCPEGELCPLDVLAHTYRESIHRCDFEGMCALPAPAPAPGA